MKFLLIPVLYISAKIVTLVTSNLFKTIEILKHVVSSFFIFIKAKYVRPCDVTKTIRHDDSDTHDSSETMIVLIKTVKHPPCKSHIKRADGVSNAPDSPYSNGFNRVL